MILSGWAGLAVGEQKLKFDLHNWKQAVILNKSTPVLHSGEKVDFSQFWIVWDKLSAEYVDKSALDPQKMVDGAISGMVSSVGDPYTVYLPPVQNQQVKEDLGGSFDGVGIELGYRDNYLAVIAPVEDSPAAKAGVKAGDLIVHITDQVAKVDRDTQGLTLPEAVKLIRGAHGTHVILTLAREGQKDFIKVDLVRDVIIVKSATVTFLNNVAWIKLSRFGDRTQDEWGAVVSQIVTQQPPVKGIVLDLRNNPGGYLEGAVYIAGEFLQPGKVVVTQQAGDGSKIDDAVTRNGSLLSVPLSIIVNKGSASAAEILSGALQDYKRGKVVGEQSFGKGSVQQPDDFPNGAGLHVTVARWLRPSGDWIDKKGITPDVVIKWSPDPSASNSADPKSDLQLQKAIEILQ